MGSGITLDNAAIVSTVLEGILYGFSLLMFIGTMWVFGQEERASKRMGVTLIAIVLLLLSTAHMVVDIVRLDEGLVKYRNTFPGGPIGFFKDAAQNTFVIKNSIYTLQTLLGDGVVIYRCYVVWQSIWAIILPAMLWCSVAVSCIGSVYSASRANASASIFANETGHWITAFYASTLTTNLFSSGLLAYRIWTVERKVSSVRTSAGGLMPIVRVLVDAAALYSAALFTALLFFANSDNGQCIVVDMIMPIISIAFYMVLIRIALQRKKINYSSSNTRATTRLAAIGDSQQISNGMSPVQVHVSIFSRSDAVDENQEFERDQVYTTDKTPADAAAYQV